MIESRFSGNSTDPGLCVLFPGRCSVLKASSLCPTQLVSWSGGGAGGVGILEDTAVDGHNPQDDAECLRRESGQEHLGHEDQWGGRKRGGLARDVQC